MIRKSDLVPIAIGAVAAPALFFTAAQIARPVLYPAPAVTHPASPTPTVTEKVTIWRRPHPRYIPVPQPSPVAARPPASRPAAHPTSPPATFPATTPAITPTTVPTTPVATSPPATTPPATFPPTTPPASVAVPSVTQ